MAEEKNKEAKSLKLKAKSKTRKEENVIDEKKLLKEAEEKEKIKKEKAKEEKKEEKIAKKEEIKETIEEKKAASKKISYGKKYRKLMEQIEKDKEYPLSDAIDLTLKTSPTKFDATVEVHVRINKKEKNIRGMVTLPGGVAKEKKIFEVTEKNIDSAIEKVKAGKIDFDIMIADLKVMPKLAPLAKVLGPKGLMPSPKAGTAVEDVEKAAGELKAGKVEYRADKNNIVHLSIGKISFGAEKIAQNYDALIHSLPFKKIETIFLTTSMGPSIKVNKK